MRFPSRFYRLILAAAFILLAAAPLRAAHADVLDVQVITTPADIEVWLVEDHTLPVISMNFSFDGGLSLDPEDKPGVAKLVSILLDEGAGDIRSQAFQQQLSNNAISLTFTPGRDAFHGQLKTITANKDTAFNLLSLALTKPRFDNDAIERMKNANTSDIRASLGDPSWLVARSFNGMIFEGHYYGAPGAGHLDSMRKITRRDLQDFTQSQFARSLLRVAIAGDITAAEAAAAVDRIFAALPAQSNIPAPKKAVTAYAGKTVLLPLNTPQTYVSIGMPGISREDKDWHAALVMNYILGGGSFDARLMKEVREKRGLTYGIYTSLVTMKYADLLQTSFSTSNDKAEEALTVIRDEFNRMAKDGPDADEIADAKAYLTGSLALELTSTGDIANALSSMQIDNLPPDYINRRNDMIKAVTAADVKAAARRLLKTEAMTTILVGQPQNINVDILLDKAPGMTDTAAGSK